MRAYKHNLNASYARSQDTRRRAYRGSISMLYQKCLSAASDGKTHAVHIYDSVPVLQDGMSSISKIRQFVRERLQLPCKALRFSGREVGIMITVAAAK